MSDPAAPVPRYTSYPTANHFSAAIGCADYAGWLAALNPQARLSLYLHIPFCRALCWYCGCTTQGVHKRAPVTSYLAALHREIDRVADILPAHGAHHIHFGGGSPDVLEPAEIEALGHHLGARFRIAACAEIATEIDPRGFTQATARAFRAIGLTRASIGVQDFDPDVQAAIGRQQSQEVTAGAVALLRAQGVRSINMDLVYGLPRQTEASVARTVDQVLAMEPDRVAVFGYAHLPGRMSRQRLIDEASLPGGDERAAQAGLIARLLTQAGYVARGIDHFAKPDDALATAPIHRNFQGYTTDAADALIGLGASSISRLPQGYAQNAPRAGEYQKLIAAGGLATLRGAALSLDDTVRAAAIERLMCGFDFSATELAGRFGAGADRVIAQAAQILAADMDRRLEATQDGFRLTPAGKPHARSIAAAFDSYLAPDPTARRHAPAI